MSTEDPLDTVVTVTGTAFDDHAGAVIERDGRRSVYITDLPYWPEEARGRPVEATGTLRSRRLGPVPTVSDDGIVTHGMGGGERLTLDDATWQLLD